MTFLAVPAVSPVSFDVAERGQLIVPCPLVSQDRGRCSSGANASAAWLAVHAGVGPAALLVSWAVSGASSEDGELPPAAYVIETSADSTDGRDGQWRRELSVEQNVASARTHVIEFDGQSWVRLVLEASAAPSFARFDLHAASDGTDDCWLLWGDSVLASAGSIELGEASWAAAIHERYPGYFPALIDASSANASPAHGVERLQHLLEAHPAARRVTIARAASGGPTVDGAGVDRDGELDAIVAAVLEAGRLPVLARQPALPGAARAAVDAFNRRVANLEARHALACGPDLAAWFDAHPDELDSEGRPTREGRAAIQRLWADALDVFYVPQ
jgi:acyl-CoA thioesterase I